MLQRALIEAASEGEHVVLAINGSRWTFHYKVALQLCLEIEHAARRAKRFAGDSSRTWRVIGTLHDANKGPDANQPFTPGKVYPVAREVVRQTGARSEGQQVVLRFDGVEAWMPYEAAQTVSMWLRQRANESRRRVGEVG